MPFCADGVNASQSMLTETGVSSSLSMPPIWISGPPTPEVSMLMAPRRGSGRREEQAANISAAASRIEGRRIGLFIAEKASPSRAWESTTAGLGPSGECGQEWIRTTEGKSQQIYSLPRLATPEPARKYSDPVARRRRGVQ
jgi:hypothetical protein